MGDNEYAGVTQRWLNDTITALANQSMLHREVKHKSAVKIQSSYRGYRIRKQNHRKVQAVIQIQKIWRGFIGRRNFYFMLRSMAEFHINTHLYRSARTIQATFRGYYCRKHVHDQGKLKKLRVESARELLKCVAVKSRILLKNHQVPGLYSLRNSKCLSKVDKLMASLRTKSYNETVKEARTKHVVKLKNAFEKSSRCRDQTEIPFGSCLNN